MKKVWKTVTLGLHKSPAGYRAALLQAGFCLNCWADDLLGRVTCLQDEVEFDLVILSVGDLGFEEVARFQQICERGLERGLKLCAAEVGPAVRLAYKDQPRGTSLVIAMDPITDWEGDLAVFVVDHKEDKLQLSCGLGDLDKFWCAADHFVFVQSRR